MLAFRSAFHFVNTARKLIADAGYGDYFIHGLGHSSGWTCMTPARITNRSRPGLVITIKPGIYLPNEKFGVRIEDNILVTETGARFLSDGLPREADEIQRWMAARKLRDVQR